METVISDGSYDNVPFMHILHILKRHGSIARAYEPGACVYREVAGADFELSGECGAAGVVGGGRVGYGAGFLAAFCC